MATSTVTFAIGGTSITVNGPRGPTQVNLLPLFVTDRAANHAIFSYQATNTRAWEWVLNLADLTEVMRTAFEDFFTNTAKGAGVSFTYTHTDGTSYASCKFKDGGLSWTRNSEGNWDVQVTVMVPTQVV